MDLRWLKPLLGLTGPFTTVYLDETRTEFGGIDEAEDRWRSVRRGLEQQGASPEVLSQLDERLSVPVHMGGPHGRVLIADAYQIRVDRALPQPPSLSEAVYGPVPSLLPAARAADESVRYLLVVVDRLGADLTLCEGAGLTTGPTRSVEGGHDVVHQPHEGGVRQTRLANRAEDSWGRNATVVAQELDRVVAREDPELVILTGDARQAALIRDAVGQRVREALVEVEGGARTRTAHPAAFQERVEAALATYRAQRREGSLGLFRAEQNRGDSAVTGLADVIDVLRRGQVRELVVHESLADPRSPIAARDVWVGPLPLDLATSRTELDAIGVETGARELRADIALVRAALGQDAGLTFAQDGSVDLVDGLGALLRWHDGSTPRDGLASQSADRDRLRAG